MKNVLFSDNVLVADMSKHDEKGRKYNRKFCKCSNKYSTITQNLSAVFQLWNIFNKDQF